MSRAAAARRRAGWALLALTALLLPAGLACGADGWSPAGLSQLLQGPDGALVVGQIRLPRTLGAWAVGALLGLAGAIAQGLFRNPLADPYLLGSASGASLAVVLVLAAATSGSAALPHAGLLGAAFVGALAGVVLTLVLARGAVQSGRLLLAGVVVGVLLSALGETVVLAAPQTLRDRQLFLLGSTAALGWPNVAWLGLALLAAVVPAAALAPALDALALGEDTAASLGLALPRLRAALVVLLALATGAAVSQAGLVAFVGLVAPHLVRRLAPSRHRFLLLASAAAGGVLLLAADVLARSVIAPRELPVGVLSAVLGGGYLLWLLRQRSA